MSNLWYDAADDLAGLEREFGAGGATIEQRLQIAQIKAILAVGQELSLFNPANTTYFGDDGQKRDGWGHTIPS